MLVYLSLYIYDKKRRRQGITANIFEIRKIKKSIFYLEKKKLIISNLIALNIFKLLLIQ